MELKVILDKVRNEKTKTKKRNYNDMNNVRKQIMEVNNWNGRFMKEK